MTSSVWREMAEGMAFGRDWREKNLAEQKRNRLAELAQGVFRNDPRATAEAYSLDPNTAKAYTQGADRQHKLFGAVAMQIKKAPTPDLRSRIWQMFLPQLKQVVPDAPDQWDDNYLSLVDQVIAQAGYDAEPESTKGTWQRGEGNALFNTRDGSIAYSESAPKAQAESWRLVNVPLEDGSKRQMLFNQKTMEFRQPNYGGAPASPTTQAPPFNLPDSPGAQDELSSLPPEEQARAAEYFRLGDTGRPVQFHIKDGRVIPGLSERPTGAPPASPRMGYTPAQRPQSATKAKPEQAAADASPIGVRNAPMGSGEIKKVRDDYKALIDTEGDFGAFERALREVGKAGTFTGAGGGQLKTAYANARAALRILYNTGVLQPGELPMLNDALEDPTTWESLADPRARERIAAQVRELMDLAERRKINLHNTYPDLIDAPQVGAMDSDFAEAMKRYGSQ